MAAFVQVLCRPDGAAAEEAAACEAEKKLKDWGCGTLA